MLCAQHQVISNMFLPRLSWFGCLVLLGCHVNSSVTQNDNIDNEVALDGTVINKRQNQTNLKSHVHDKWMMSIYVAIAVLFQGGVGGFVL